MRHDHSNVYNFHIDIHHSESLGAEVGDPREDEPGRAVEQGEHPAAADDAPGAGQRADVLKCHITHKWGVQPVKLRRLSAKMLTARDGLVSKPTLN